MGGAASLTVRQGVLVRLAAVVCASVVLATCPACSGGGETELNRPWTRTELSSDGKELTVWVEPPGDDECEVFDRIDVERDSGTAVVSAVYIRTEQEFCEVPCPLTDQRRTTNLDQPLPGLEIKPHPETVASCR